MPTKLDSRLRIPESTRNQTAELLQERLVELIDLSLQAKQAHWNLTGPNFIAVHELFDQITGRLRKHADDVAERIVTLGFIPKGRAQDVAEAEALPAFPVDVRQDQGVLEAFADRLAQTAEAAHSSIHKLSDLGDAVSEDILTGIAGELEKDLWFIESHLGAH